MRRLIIIVAALAVAIMPVLADASTWKLDPAHSQVGFKVRHLMVSNVSGNFGKVAGDVELDEKDVTKSHVAVTIETASVDTANAKRDEHLRSADFLDTAKFPTISFVSKKVVKNGPDRLKVTGDLTIRGVTKEAVLDVEGPTAAIKDMQGMQRRGASATTRISRKDYGLTWNKMLEAGGVAVGDEVNISLDVEMIKK